MTFACHPEMQTEMQTHDHTARRVSRRRGPRVPFSGNVALFTWEGQHEVTPLDLGTGGVFLCSDDPLPEGKFVTLRLDLPSVRRSMTVLGRVVRSVRATAHGARRMGMAVRFIDLAGLDREQVQAYVTARA